MKMRCYRVNGDTYVEINTFDRQLDIDDLEGLIEFLQLEIRQIQRREEKIAQEKRCVYAIQRRKEGLDWKEFTPYLESIDDAIAMIKRLKKLTNGDTKTEDEWRVSNIITGAIHLPARELKGVT